MAPSREDDLAELGLNHSESRAADEAKTIRLAYLKQSKLRHPDKGGTKEDFQRLSNAYQRLSDKNHRYPVSGSKKKRQHPPAQEETSNNNHRSSSTSGASEQPAAGGANDSRPKTSSPARQKTYQKEDTSSSNNSRNTANEDDDDSRFWYNEYFHFFRRAWSGHYDRDERSYNDYFSNWETATRKQRARERYENVKRGYDFRDKKVTTTMTTSSTRGGRKSAAVCMFCGTNRPITKRTAEKHGLNWTEYIRTKTSQQKYGYPTYNTCWACKNSHKSVMTRKQALAKFTVRKVPVLEKKRGGGCGADVFTTLRQMGRSFHHQPVTSYVEQTLNSEYFWYPDLEKEALARGWQPRGDKIQQVPWIPKGDESTSLQQKLLTTPTRGASDSQQQQQRQKKKKPPPSPQQTMMDAGKCSSRTPKRRRITAAPVVTASGGDRDGNANNRDDNGEESVPQKLQPKNLFDDDEQQEQQDKTDSDWRVFGAKDY